MENDAYSTTIYTVPFSAFPITSTGGNTAYDLWSGKATTSGRMELKELNVGELSTNPAGNQQLSLGIYRGSTALGGGSPVTPVNTKGWATAQSANTVVNAPSSNLASTASATLLYAKNTDWSGDFEYRPDEPEEFTFDTGQPFFVRISAPASGAGTVQLTGTLTFKEINKLK